MAVGHRLQNLLGHDRCFKLRKLLALNNFIEELFAVAEFCYEEEILFVFENFIKSHNAWMIQVFEDFNLVFKTHFFLVTHSVFLDDFDSAYFRGADASAFLNAAKSAFSQNLCIKLVDCFKLGIFRVFNYEIRRLCHNVFLRFDLFVRQDFSENFFACVCFRRLR